jgi:Serine incorporator (Serinc)
MVMTGSMAVYRLSFAMVIFFAIFMILTINVKSSTSYRGYLHNGLVGASLTKSCIAQYSFRLGFGFSRSYCSFAW